jgi:shikimate kinase
MSIKGMAKGIIILTGPKHSGKTSVGRILAKRWNCGLVDLDELVETRTGKSPRTLYKEGPETFRAAELQALKSLISLPPAQQKAETNSPALVAAGGGIIDNDPARTLLERSSQIIIIYLEIPADIAWERICQSSAKTGEFPPFLNTDNPQETHRGLHIRRAAAYKTLAHITIQAEGKTPDLIGMEICRKIDGIEQDN